MPPAPPALPTSLPPPPTPPHTLSHTQTPGLCPGCRAGRYLQRCYMSLKLVNCLLASGASHWPSTSPLQPHPPPTRPTTRLWSSGISRKLPPCPRPPSPHHHNRKYLILAMTDNVVRPPDGFYAVITSAPPSVALWIIQDYVVIPLILIALRFSVKIRQQ